MSDPITVWTGYNGTTANAKTIKNLKNIYLKYRFIERFIADGFT